MEQPFIVLSKDELLSSVWDDVEGTEQVLFQTIAELRQVFNGITVIKTHPRKGYAWVADVQVVESLVEPESNTSKQAIDSFAKTALLLLGGLLLASTMFFYFAQSGEQGQSNQHTLQKNLSGSLVILPVQSYIEGNGDNWVRFGAMDQMISSIESNRQTVVMATDYVLEIIKDAGLTHKNIEQDVSRIFEVSGASFVVETHLSGIVGQYQLRYTFHFRQSNTTGVILDDTIQSALSQLVDKIIQLTGQDSKKSVGLKASGFTNEMLARALDQKDKNNHQAAIELLEGLVHIEPENIVALRLLASSHMEQRQANEAARYLLKAERLAGKNNSELAKIRYLLAYIAYIHGDLRKSTELTANADRLALTHNDWLYRGLIAQLRAKIDIQYGNFDDAEASLHEALEYHGVIKCPIGKSSTLLDLSLLANERGEHAKSSSYFEQAKQLINKRQLTTMKIPLKDVSEKIK